ncbi:MAG: tRNA (adenosine(37)-N6)-dimethylallyltransferase MiaA, partial [Candidatus Eisenbacteria bacterium]|nr:tRNA (adenosine(37)-N6)-dimethylallyltransferase MiaA [Candidatus Eisenbacteria bacterium]
ATLNKRAAEEGAAALHSELRSVDPESAARIHKNDASRIVRALEVYLMTGRTLTEWHAEETRTPAHVPFYIGLTAAKSVLYRRINSRVDRMMEAGFLEEVRHLVASGHLASDMPAASAVGYRELLPIVEGGEGDLDGAVELIKRSTRRYAKRQLTWFSSLSYTAWIDVGERGTEQAAKEILSRWRDRAGPRA